MTKGEQDAHKFTAKNTVKLRYSSLHRTANAWMFEVFFRRASLKKFKFSRNVIFSV